MQWKLLSDTRVSLIFLLIFFIFPINIPDGFSIVLFNIFNFKNLSYGYLYLIAGLVISFIESNFVIDYYDKNRKIVPKHRTK